MPVVFGNYEVFVPYIIIKMKKKVNIIHVGASGIPFVKSAAINRCVSIYSLFSTRYFDITTISNKVYNFSEYNIHPSGKIENISYFITSPVRNKSKYFALRRFHNFLSKFNELKLLIELRIKNKIDIIVYYPASSSFLELMKYVLLSKLFRVPIIMHYVEYRSGFETRSAKIWKKYNDYFFDNYFMFLIDGVIPISQFLKDNILKKNSSLPLFKLPPVLDFNKFDNIEHCFDIKYFLYVGSLGYHEALRTILNAFNLIENEEYKLYLVLNGSNNNLLDEIHTHPKRNLIKIYSEIEYSKLLRLNLNASALLIPLRFNIQDEARFPQKICEYLASKNPIITTNVGEIKYFFKDGVNALVAKSNEISEISNKMNYVINNPLEAKKIGMKGYETGKEYFESNVYRLDLEKFVLDLIEN